MTLELGLRVRLAQLQGDVVPDLGLALAHQRRSRAQDLGPILGSGPAPDLEPLGGGLQRVVEILVAGAGQPADDLLVRRVDHRQIVGGCSPRTPYVEPDIWIVSRRSHSSNLSRHNSGHECRVPPVTYPRR